MKKPRFLIYAKGGYGAKIPQYTLTIGISGLLESYMESGLAEKTLLDQ
jgi:hypothetical protein